MSNKTFLAFYAYSNTVVWARLLNPFKKWKLRGARESHEVTKWHGLGPNTSLSVCNAQILINYWNCYSIKT